MNKEKKPLERVSIAAFTRKEVAELFKKDKNPRSRAFKRKLSDLNKSGDFVNSQFYSKVLEKLVSHPKETLDFFGYGED